MVVTALLEYLDLDLFISSELCNGLRGVAIMSFSVTKLQLVATRLLLRGMVMQQ